MSNNVIEVITIIITSVMSFILFFSVWFGIMTNVFGFKYRRDANLGLRKDYHINILENYYEFIENFEDMEKMKEGKYDVKLLGFLSSPLSPKKYRDSITKNSILESESLLEELKNWKTLENDFMINKKSSFKTFIKKRNLDFEIENKKDALTIIILLLINLNTDTIELVIVEDKYKRVLKYFKQISLTKKQLKRKVKNNEISVEDAVEAQEEQKNLENEIIEEEAEAKIIEKAKETNEKAEEIKSELEKTKNELEEMEEISK